MATTVAELLVKIGADVSEAARGLDSVSSRLTNFGKQAAATGGLLSLGITAPLGAIAKTALDTAIDYQSSLNLMRAVSGATAEQMALVDKRATELGADMSLPGTSAADAALAMTELAKAGLSVAQSMDAARGVLQLAAASGLDEATSAEIVANALNAFSLSGERATQVADLLAAAANSSSAEMTDVADSLQMASSVFASAGIPLEELTTAIGQMANAGIKGSDAGTSLKQMLLSLQAPSQKAADLMNSLGISLYDADGKMRPFGNIIEQFSTKLGGLSQEQRNAALATIFGSDAVRAANIVLMGGVEAHQQMYAAVTKSGAAADLASAKAAGLGGALDGLKSQIETVLLDAAKPFLATLENLARRLADLVGKIGDIDPGLRDAALAFAAVFAAAGPVLAIIGALGAAVGFLLSPIGLVVLAVAALAAAWASDFGGIRETVQSVINFIAPLIQKVIGALIAWWNENWPFIRRTAETVFNAVREVIETVLAIVVGIITTVVGGIQRLWQEHGDQILQIARGVWEAIRSAIEMTINVIAGIIQAVMRIIRGDWQGAWEAIQGIAESLVSGLTGIFNGLATALGGIWDYIRTTAEAVWLGIKTKAEEVWGGIKKFLEGLWGGLQTTVNNVFTGIRTFIESTWDGIREAIRGAINTIIGFVNTLIRAWNALHLTIPGFSIPIPGDGTISWEGLTLGVVQIPELPGLAAGGIVMQPTLAMLGESGPEAVVPLTSGGIGRPIHINITVEGSVIAERDLAERLREELLRLGERNMSVGLA